MATNLNRRQMLGVAAAAALAARPSAADDPAVRRTFVLVHGAWHGGWCWKKVTPLLRAAGHEVYTPTLTGLGERSHLFNTSINLDTHIQDVAAVMEYEDLRNVTLVGHSYGGMVVTGVVGKAAERIGHLVYLDAFLPENGKSMNDYSPRSKEAVESGRTPTKSFSFSVTDPQDLAWMKPRLGDHPTKTLTQAVHFSQPEYDRIPKSYIRCTPASFFVEAGERARRLGLPLRGTARGRTRRDDHDA